MIYYESARFHPRLLFQLRGSVCMFATAMALPCALLSAALKTTVVEGLFAPADYPFLGLSGPDQVTSAAFSAASSLLGFIIVFRTSQAYNRFWEGCSSLHEMLGEWFDATSSLVAFCKMSPADLGDVVLFQHTLIRLVSLLNAVVLVNLNTGFSSNADIGLSARAFDLELIDAEGLDSESLKVVNQSDEKVELIFQWIQQLIVETQCRGVFSQAPPIVSRAFQELANGMVKYHQCLKIATVPLPFPYMQVMEWMLIIHWCVTPFLTCIWVETPLWAGVLTFLQIFFFWSLNTIAGELENPFGEDVNDLPAEELQLEMNKRLLLLLRPSTQRTPHLSQRVAFDETQDAEKPKTMNLGRRHSIGKDGLSMALASHQLTGLARRINLGSLTESIRDIGKTAYTSEDQNTSESSITFTPLKPVKEELFQEVSQEVVQKSANVFSNGRSLEDHILNMGESLTGRLQEHLAVCQDIRDTMRGFKDSERLLATLGTAVCTGRDREGRTTSLLGEQKLHDSFANRHAFPGFCCTQIEPSAARKVEAPSRPSSFSEHPPPALAQLVSNSAADAHSAA